MVLKNMTHMAAVRPGRKIRLVLIAAGRGHFLLDLVQEPSVGNPLLS